MPVDFEEIQQPKVILCICYSDGLLGAAVYDQSNTTVKILHDVSETDDYNGINLIFEQIEPTTVLACKSQDLNYLRYLTENCRSEEEPKKNSQKEPTRTNSQGAEIYQPGALNTDVVPDSQATSTNIQDPDEEEEFNPFKEAVLHLMPSNNFRFDQSINRIGELFTEEVLTKSEADIILQFRLETKAINMVRAFGALLKYMDATRIGVEYEMLNIRTPVTAIKTFIIDQMVEMDYSSYRALEIFGEDRKKEVGWRKAMSQNFHGTASLFSLMNRTRSSSGKYTLLNWFSRPTLNRETLKARQKAISFFIQDGNNEVASYIHQCMGKVRNTKMILKRMRGSLIKPQHWKSLFETLKSVHSISKCLEERKLSFDILEPFQDCFGNDLTQSTFLIGYMVDLDESTVEGRLVVNAGVDSDIDELKLYYKGLPQLLTKAAQDEADRLNAEDCSVGYVPIVGYILALPLSFPASLFADLKVIYTGDDRMHVKSKLMNQLDEDLGDIKMQIIDKETTIALRLQKALLGKSKAILGACKAAAILDAVISMAYTARQFGWNCPTLSSESVIEATQCVHPLMQMLSKDERFIPNPVSCGGNDTKVKIFTGPNACGKSVYMKQVGILAYLTHIGSFVPAQRAIVGPISRIMTRVYTVDGVLDGMSTFAKDIQQISLALRRANKFSLVIIDEFGKGTLTEVGLSLLASSLNHWVGKKEDCPHLLVSSHFHSLPKHIKESNNISYHTFEVLKRGNRLDYLFRLVDGLVDRSHAAYTAGRMGIPSEVVRRSNEVYTVLRDGLHVSEIIVHDVDQAKYDFLARRMEDFDEEFEKWNIEHDSEGLLNRIEELFLDDTEHVSYDVSSRMRTPERLVKEEQMEVQTEYEAFAFQTVESASNSQIESPEEITSRASDLIESTSSVKMNFFIEQREKEKVTSIQFAVPFVPNSILKQRDKPTPRGNLSVSFATTSPLRYSPPICNGSLLNSSNEIIMQPVSPIKDFNELFYDSADEAPALACKKMRFG